MYVCKYVCMCVCVYVCMYVCLSVCLSVCLYVCMYVCMYVYMIYPRLPRSWHTWLRLLTISLAAVAAVDPSARPSAETGGWPGPASRNW